MYFVIAIILILCGLGMAIYGNKKYNISLALAFILPNLALLYYINEAIGGSDYVSYAYIAVITIGVLVLLFAKIFTYVYAWWITILLIILVFSIIYAQADLEPGRVEAYVILALSTLIVILIRKSIKKIIIGLSSGYFIGLGIAAIGAYNFMGLGWGYILDAIYYPALTIFIITLAGLAYQFYLDNAEKKKGSLSVKQVNLFFGGGTGVIALVFIILPLFKKDPSNNAKLLAEEYCKCVNSLSSLDAEEIDASCKSEIGFSSAIASISSMTEAEAFMNVFSEEIAKCGADFMDSNLKQLDISTDKSKNNNESDDLQNSLEQLQKAAEELKRLQDESSTPEAQPSKSTINRDAANIVSNTWTGDFGKKRLTLSLKATSDGQVTGVNKVGTNTRTVNGEFRANNLTSFALVLNEPGDDEWDGIFTIEVTQADTNKYIMKGVWNSNNGKISRDFTLTKDI